MTRRRWLLALVALAATLLALSFVDGWVVHDREVRGEGYRHVRVFLDAWQTPAFPVLGVGIGAAAATGLLAVAALRGARLPRLSLAIGAAVTLGLVAATLPPVRQDGQASSVILGISWVGLIGIVVAGLVATAAVRAVPVDDRTLLLLGVVAVLVGGAAFGGRWATLQLKEGSGRHWSDGAYVRPAPGTRGARGTGSLRLVIDGGSFSVGRWAGRWAGNGVTVTLDDDPACPAVHAAYNVRAAALGSEDITITRIVDTCADGARAADLDGAWARQP